MGHIAFVLAFVALPVIGLLLTRSFAWTAAAFGAGIAVFGAAVTFGNDRGHDWTWFELEWMTLGALLVPVLGLLVLRRNRGRLSAVDLGHQLFAVGLPMLIVGLGVVLSRLVAAPRSGLFTAVGFLVQRTHGEDNAKWLDFTGQLAQGTPIHQAVPMGGPLQLVLVPVADVLAAISQLAFGGVNQVLVAANTVVYGEFLLATLAGIALAPLAEHRFVGAGAGAGAGASADRTSPLPGPLVWAGILVMTTGSLAVSGLGHLSLQYVMPLLALWVSAFVVRADTRLRTIASLALIPSFLVWFPLTPISILIAAIGILVGLTVLRRSTRGFPWFLAVTWITAIALSAGQMVSSLRYMTDTQNATTAVGPFGGAGAIGGVSALGSLHAAVSALRPALDLLTSQGGTEVVAPILAILGAVSAIGAVAFLHRSDGPRGPGVEFFRYAPAGLIGTYAVGLSVSGTWWAGGGPNYGALKTTFLVTIVITSVGLPLALRALDVASVRTTLVHGVAIAAVLYLLAVDGVLDRAVTYASPQQWPSAAADARGYWWPAEVKDNGTQTIASLPVACAYRLDPTKPPSALPDGQLMYSCTRILSGLSGADWEALALVNWARREWFTNSAAWDNEYPNFLNMPDWVKRKNFILLDFDKQVIGLESVQSFMDRYRPPWAQGGAQ